MKRMRKIRVMDGVFWVEIPDIRLFILCGCPGDTVKHLMKRGLIVPTEVDGVACETGPNAILLSDVPLQNGHFSNLAEFPVLQMLYRQGMILPNHPNNNGIRPLLLGRREQIAAQMDYIFRGNYGLVSQEEIEATGIPRDQAETMMAIKLKFAFGKIRPTEELLDDLPVEETPVEIRGGVTIRRLGFNRYEFACGEERVQVDMGLPPNRIYPSPYPLNFHNVKREYFAIIHSGQGDGWDINRPSMGSAVMFQGKVYLIDAGPNIEYSLMALGIGINEIEGIFHTHCHDDHFAGLTTLIRSDHRIKYFATPLVRASVFKKLAALLTLDETSLTDYFDIHDLEFDRWNEIEGLLVRPVYSPHPVETSIFFFRTYWEEGFQSYGHLADISALKVLDGMVDESAKGGISRFYYDQVRAEYLTPVDIKKIDIGGGMIHGQAEDFQDDDSERIILAHTSAPLTTRQKEIGSSAPFGVVDILIPDFTDHLRDAAGDFLSAYFPHIPGFELRKLLNNPIVTFNPGSIIIKGGETNDVIHLILTGIVEKFSSGKGIYNVMSAGGMVGEYSGLNGFAANTTYRTVSFVDALRLSAASYLEFIKRNQLYSQIEKLHENREFLQSTGLFGENISIPTQNRIAQTMIPHCFQAGDGTPITPSFAQSLFLVQRGAVVRLSDGKVVETVRPGAFFGEERILTMARAPHQYQTDGAAVLFEIPGVALKGIPIVQIKLLEVLEKRGG